SIYQLKRWPKSQRAIVGGGTVIHLETVSELYNRYKNNPQNLAILGVDIEDFSVIEKYSGFISDLAYFSARSAQQAIRVNDVIGRNHAKYHPDIVFTLKGVMDQHPPCISN